MLVLLVTACGSIARPQGWSAPEIKNDTLYVSLNHGTLSAYRLAGAHDRLWEFPAKDERVRLVVKNGATLPSPRDEKISFEGLYGDPVISSDGVYATAYSGHVIALGTDGRARWVAELPGRIVGGALVTADTVYAGTTRGDLFALARDSGAVRWRRTAGNEVWSTPVSAGDLIYVTSMDGSVYAFDARNNGAPQWQTRVADAAIASTPVLNGTTLYVGAFDKRMYAVDVQAGKVLWRSELADNWFWTQVLVQGDTLFAGSLGGTVYALDAGSGRARWSLKVGTLIRSRPALVDGVLVVGSKDGRLHGLHPADGTRVWQVSNTPAPDDPTAPRGDLYADLAPVSNGVYASTESGRSAGHVYFLDMAQRKVSEVALK